MEPEHARNRPRSFPALAAAAWLICILAAAAATIVAQWGCSIDKHYKTLSFFFDGVPDPNAPGRVSGGGAASTDIQQSPTYSAHKPWKEERCEECHARALKLGGRDSDVCLKCHAEKTTQHEFMHGPVAVGDCLWCHNPHNSAYAHLLKAPARQTCTQCHATSLLDSTRVPEHAQERSCLDCHDGHGGNARFFLLPSRGTSQ
jgi:predicted CXXCH cytochrome family protein